VDKVDAGRQQELERFSIERCAEEILAQAWSVLVVACDAPVDSDLAPSSVLGEPFDPDRAVVDDRRRSADAV
jgi:hypothetical protein